MFHLNIECTNVFFPISIKHKPVLFNRCLTISYNHLYKLNKQCSFSSSKHVFLAINPNCFIDIVYVRFLASMLDDTNLTMLYKALTAFISQIKYKVHWFCCPNAFLSSGEFCYKHYEMIQHWDFLEDCHRDAQMTVVHHPGLKLCLRVHVLV